MPTGNDERLIREILAGDIDRFEEIVRGYQNRIAGLAFRMGIRFDDMEDVTVEIMTKTFRNLHLYRPEYAFSTWIYRVAINHIRDHHRRRRRDAVLEPISEHLPATGTDALQAAGEDQRRLEIRIALSQLPERYRTAMILMHLEEKSLAEIAAILDLPVGTIKSRLSRGRERLRQILIRKFPHLGEK